MTAIDERCTHFPIGRDAPYSLPAFYAGLCSTRASRVRMSDGRDAWFFHRHSDVQQLMLHPSLSSDRSDPGFPAISAGGKNAFEHFAPFLISMDGSEHLRNRKPLIQHFSMKRMREFRPRIEVIVDDAIAEMVASGISGDIVTAISTKIPRRVIAEIMGVTPDHLSRFYELAGRFLDRSLLADDRDDLARAMRENMDALVEHKRVHRGDDVLSHEIARHEHEFGHVDVPALASLSQLMLLAGHESTSEMITLGILALLTHPDERATLMAHPERFPTAVTELIRFFSVVEIGMARVATVDFDFAGVTVKAGDGLVASNIAANRDAAVFDRPNELILDRNPNPHLAQGFGAHHCIGMNLAQVELGVVYERIFRALPTLRASTDDLPFKYDGLIFGLSSLPVTW
nr:cytochrome P450 [Rhodococcus sp. (in: high G+C Gram-positive bacteria)]